MSGVISNKSDLYTPAGANDFRGDYLGFTFNGIHSSELGLVRVSSSNRYDDNLLPTIQDKTVQVPGGDGMYFFGSYYTQRQFTISFAFDALTDAQLRRLRTVLGDKKIHPLIFDEMPYKVYQAKVTGNNTVKHLAFDHGQGARIYKGEGSIQFTCYFPFARSRYRFEADYTLNNIPEWKEESDINLSEWIEASGMSKDIFTEADAGLHLSQETYDELAQIMTGGFSTENDAIEPEPLVNSFIEINEDDIFLDDSSEVYLEADGEISTPWGSVEYPSDTSCYGVFSNALFRQEEPSGGDFTGFITYNPGDVETDWRLVAPVSDLYSGIIIRLVDEDDNELGRLDLNPVILAQDDDRRRDSRVIIDTKTNTIIGETTGLFYNEFLKSGTFFKLPQGINYLELKQFVLNELGGWRLDYDYLYY